VPVPVNDVPVPPDLAGHGLVAGAAEADRGQGRPDGAGEGQVPGPDGEPGAPSLFRAGSVILAQTLTRPSPQRSVSVTSTPSIPNSTDAVSWAGAGP
jgi:hypothetical protein